MPKERILGYDAVKAISAFLVVLYHVYLIDYGYKDGEYYYPTTVLVLWLFTACSVPLFFMINGALTVKRSYSFKASMVKASRLWFLGLFWGGVLKLLFVFRYQDFSVFSTVSITRYWFFFTLAMLYFLQYFLKKTHKWFRVVLIIGLLVFPFLTNLVWDVIIFIKPSVVMPSWGHSGFFTLYSLVYLYAGGFFATLKYRKSLIVLCFVVGLLIMTFGATATINYRNRQINDLAIHFFPTIGALFLSIAMFLTIKDWTPKSNKLRQMITLLGNNSMGIYIVHFLLLVVIRGLIPELQTMTFHPFVVLVIALAYTMFSAVISEIIGRSPIAFLIRI